MEFVAIDFETANEQRISACALGIVVVDGNRIATKSSWLIRPPDLRFNSLNISLHGITEQDVVREPTFDQLWSDIGKYVNGKTVIAHNASFDLGVLRSLLDLYGIAYPELSCYCTCVLSRRVWPALNNHKLTTVAAHLGISFRHHDASEDAVACARIALACCEKGGAADLTSLGTKLGVSPHQLHVGRARPRAGSMVEAHAHVKTQILEAEELPAGATGNMTVSFTKSGLSRYEIEIRHDELNRFQVIRSDDPNVAQQKAQVKLAQWDEAWSKKEEAEQRRREKTKRTAKIEDNKALAAERTQEAEAELADLENVLAHTLDIDDSIDWEALKDRGDFPKSQPKKPAPPSKPQQPNIPPEPRRSDATYQPVLGILDKIISSRRETKNRLAKALYDFDLQEWKEEKARLIEDTNAQIRNYNETITSHHAQFKQALATWESERTSYLATQKQRNAAIDHKRERYLSGEPEAIRDYCDMVLSNSQYADYFPQTYDLDYRPENKLLILDYHLPSPHDLPKLKEVKYVQSKHEFVEKYISDAQLAKLYDSVLCQISLRTIHELFEADKADAIDAIVFNGIVDSVDRATGQETRGCVMSLQANKEEFEGINLAQIDPKACFRKLRGVGSSKLHSLTPIAPIVQLDKEDRRFVSSYDVAYTIEEGDNLASMDWQDFEHLIRELFEKHFAAGGGEVKVTRASRDGGVDAVVFDPDPIRGGKIVIQAKRYTNTVGVAAIRDLYGTVVNEGANKGILVTTSQYGPDAYAFAKGKPLSLLDGSNLLHLLQSHGHKARIDLNEAKAANG